MSQFLSFEDVVLVEGLKASQINCKFLFSLFLPQNKIAILFHLLQIGFSLNESNKVKYFQFKINKGLPIAEARVKIKILKCCKSYLFKSL